MSTILVWAVNDAT